MSRDSSLKALQLTSSGSDDASGSSSDVSATESSGSAAAPASDDVVSDRNSDGNQGSGNQGSNDESGVVSEAVDPAASGSLSLGRSSEDGASIDDDLEHGFFSRGLSDDHLRAASEQQGEREVFIVRPTGQRRRIALGFCGLLVLGMIALGVRNFVSDRRASAPEAEPPPFAAATSAPAVVPSPEALPTELIPPIGALDKVVTVDQLRARTEEMPEGAAPEGLTPEGAAIGEVAGPEVPGQEATGQEVTGQAVPGQAPVEVPGQEPAAAPAAPAAAPPPPAAPAPAPPAGESNNAAPASSSRVAACTSVLRSRRIRDIEARCTAAFEAQPAAALAAEVAQAVLELGRNVEAAVWARRAIGVDPKHASAFVLLGGAEQQLGHAAEARAAYARYLELAPDGEHAQDIRALLPRLAGM